MGLLALTSSAGESLTALRSSALAITPDGHRLLVVNPDSDSVTIVDLAARKALAEVPVGDDPQSIAVGSSGRIAVVPNRRDDTVSLIDLNLGTAVETLPVGDEPAGALVDHRGRLYVANAGSASISVIGLDGGALLATVPTEPRPRGLALSPDGTTLYVTHFLSGRLSVIDTKALTVETVISTGPDSNLSNGIFINPNTQRAYLPQTRSNTTNRALLFDTTVFPVVSVIDLTTNGHLRRERIALDVADRPVGIPFDAAVAPRRGELYVVNAASNDLSMISLDSGRAVAHLDVGDHPRGIVLSPDERFAYVNNTLSGDVSVIDTIEHQVVETIDVTDIPLSESLLNGKRLFNSSARVELARDRWISCATCHFDGGMDGRTWFFRDGPRNTPSLLGVRETLPIHWSGDLDELHDVERTIRTIQAGTGLAPGSDNCDPTCDQGPPNAGRSQDLDDLVAYLRTLNLPPNPNRNPDGTLSANAERGRTIFLSKETGCSSCHAPPLYTDRRRHDVGTGESPLETQGSSFDTPSLRGIYATAPYLHDGRAATLMDVLTENANDRHGVTSHLTNEQLADLVAFLESISTDPER